MVIKGGARAEANKLAAHLLRVDMNERVDVREVLGVCSPDLTAALLEMEAIASAARSRRPFYHASINTAPNELMTDAQKARAIDRLEQELGLTGQPRIVVEHVKEGREHLHVAWSRIDGETLCAIPDSHNYRKHEIVARELEREFEHARVQGAHHEREGVERPARRPSHAETRQAERSGIGPEEAKAQLRELWQSADNGHAFVAALDNAGWTLAQGDRRGFVALDPAGEVRAVNKDITGLSAAKVRERMGDLDPSQLPTVDEARARQRERQPQPEPAPAASPEVDREADELARLDAMAREFDSRDYDDQAAPEFEPEPEDFGHGLDDWRDLAHEREAAAEARARVGDAALAAEHETMRREIAEHEAALAELDAINEAVRDQFREQRQALNEAEHQLALDEMRAREAQQRSDDSALNARQAMEDLARVDPLGTERNFGYHAGDRLKSPEEMRRDWADLMRGGVSAARTAEARDAASPDPAPVHTQSRSQANGQAPDHTAERTAWADRLRGLAAKPAQEARREAEPDRTRERTAEPGRPTQPPEKERGGLFQKLRDFVRGWFEAAPQPAPQPDRAADRQHDADGDRQGGPIQSRPAKQPAPQPQPEQARQPQAKQDRTQQPEQEAACPAERFMKRDFADELLAEARARLAKQTPEQQAERDRSQADQPRGRGDGSRERTRHRHSLLWELVRPFHDQRSRNRQRPTP